MNDLGLMHLFRSMTVEWANLILNVSVKGTIIILIAVMISYYKGKITSHTKHFILTSSMASLLLLPVFDMIMNYAHISLFKPLSGSGKSYLLPVYCNVDRTLLNDADARMFTLASDTGIPDLKAVIFLLWLIGFILLTFRIVFGLIKIRKVVKGSKEIKDSQILNYVQFHTNKINLEQNLKVYSSCMISSPVAFGFTKPAIILPDGFDQWDEERLNVVLLHEICHIKRRDNFICVAASFISAFYWFNPLVWFAVKRLRIYQEMACDERVLRDGIRPYIYASHLLAITKAYRNDGLLSGVFSSMASISVTEKRIFNILNTTNELINLKRLKVSLIACVFCMVIILSLVNISRSEFAFNDKIVITPKDNLVSISGFNINIKDALPEEVLILNPLSLIPKGSYLKYNYSYNNTSGCINKNGVDIYAEAGEEWSLINASGCGYVIDTGIDSKAGGYVIIQHDYGASTMYSNLNEINVYKGQYVERGQLIGCLGNNRKLHFELRLGNDCIDPIPFLEAGTKMGL
jgi:beta-lactamase regulating signal transducer with metallopeptidase domain